MDSRGVEIHEGMMVGGSAPLALIAGPCVIEDAETPYRIASTLKSLTRRLEIPFIFKASFDKANRSAIDSFRGPGVTEGLEILKRIKTELGVCILSDVHRISQIDACTEVLDVIQIPAFLCRQTDLVTAAAAAGKPVNIKKGQFLAPKDMANVVHKAASTGNKRILITERGSCFGYNNLVVDFRGIPIMQKTGCPVIFDATHSVQLPGGETNRSGGERQFAPVLAKAAVAAGADGIFMEVHPTPEQALCDGPNSLPLDDLEALLATLVGIRTALSASAT
ncbi:MAG: 3-deoxy-8-phosphooctulonate synthase [Deltaproteobacteria bacterium]|nr:3-deoxy-8-phosphooctulonate synthase [Deltaproteobacteria bacterium]